jgi:predicted enzyme related to lactoylglutathione lyase
VFKLKTINHVTLTIANGSREKEFYQTAFGLPVRAMQGDGVTLAIGEGTDGVVFNAAANNPNAVSGINHACFTIENFDPERVMATLIESGVGQKRLICSTGACLLSPAADMPPRGPRQQRATPRNRCAIARCAAGLPARTVPKGAIVDSGMGALS